MRVVRYFYTVETGSEMQIDLLVTGEGPTGFQVWGSEGGGKWLVDDEPTTIIYPIQHSQLLGVVRGVVIS